MDNFVQVILYLFIILNCGRVFLTKIIKNDSLVILAPITVLLSFLNIISLGLNPLSFQLFIISVLCLIINVHALLRYSEKLFIDKFSFVMKIMSSIILVLSFISLISFGINCPSKVNKDDLNIKITKRFYKGNFKDGFEEADDFSLKNVYFTEYKRPRAVDNPLNVVVFIADKRGDSKAYEPYLQYLADYGTIVCAFDFYMNDYSWDVKNTDRVRRSFELINKSLDTFGNPYLDDINKYDENIQNECKAIVDILGNLYGKQCKFFFISDVIGNISVMSFANNNPNKVTGYFTLNSIEEYKTPGYGCVEMTNPYLAKKLNVKPDKSGFIPKYMALKSSEKIFEVWSKL